MAKKQDAYYFETFIACAEYSCKEAHLLKEILTEFKPEGISGQLDQLHEIEREADDQKHQMTDALAKAFITPIEREDIAALCSYVDDVTDKIEEVLIRIYINNVQAIRPEALQMLDIVISCCEEVRNLLKEFRDFKRSRRLQDCIIHINTLEEQEDALFIASMRALHTEETDLREVIAWREIYTYLEKCADACEHVADVVGGITMKNS